MKTINKMETLKLNLTLIYFQPNASAYSPVTARSEHWEHCWIHFHTFAIFPPTSQDRPILHCSRHLSFFPCIWLWLEEQCQPLFDTLFAAKCVVCLVAEECCRRGTELVAEFGGVQDQVPHSLATCTETCATEQLHRTAPSKKTVVGWPSRIPQASYSYHRIHVAHHLCLCWTFCFTVILMLGLVWTGGFASFHPKIQLSQLIYRGDLNLLVYRSAAKRNEKIYHWIVSYPWVITTIQLQDFDSVFGGDGKFACTCSFWGVCLKRSHFLSCSVTVSKPGVKSFQWHQKRTRLSLHQSTNLRFPLLKVASSYYTSKIETLSARRTWRLGVCADTSIQRTVIRGKFLLLNQGLN